MKKVLIISYYYKHKNAMASIRPIKLAKYLSELLCDVTVLTSNQKDTWTKDYVTPIQDPQIKEIYAPEISRWTRINGFLEHRKRAGQAKIAKQTETHTEETASGTSLSPSKMSLKGRIKNYLGWLFYFNLAKQEDICMFNGLKKEFKKDGRPQYDAVIATYPTYGAFLMGMWLKRKGYCKHLIADFRDPLYNPGFRNKKQESDYDKNCLKKILNVADQVVCVSKGIADGITQEFPEFHKPIHIITNGYDPDDVVGNNIPVAFDKDKIHFVYTGTLYHGKRCVDMLARVLKELSDENRISSADFVFEYAGPDYAELLSQLSAYGLENTAVDHGFVSREESIALQKHADALILLTWNEKTYQGVVPGKLFEYMAIGTAPIIALVTGDVANSEVAQLIAQSNAGIACEEAEPEQLEELKSYVAKLFSKEFTFVSKAEDYNYKKITERYLKVLS